jgi:hypothetical protein
MKRLVFAGLVALAAHVTANAQDTNKPVPKDSVRVSVPGCSKDYIFTAGRATEDQPGGNAVPEGMHLRMNAPKKTMAEIKGQEGSRIEITGLMKKGQVGQEGIAIGRGVRVLPGNSGPAAGSGGGMSSPGSSQVMIDVEGWWHIAGTCPR